MLDPEKHEADKRRFLGIHYDLAKAYVAAHPRQPDMTHVDIDMNDVAAGAGCSDDETYRFCKELQDEELIKSVIIGPKRRITLKGMKAVEADRFARSPRGKIRRGRRWLTEGATKAVGLTAEAIWTGLLGLLGGWLLGVASADQTRAFGRWVWRWITGLF